MVVSRSSIQDFNVDLVHYYRKNFVQKLKGVTALPRACNELHIHHTESQDGAINQQPELIVDRKLSNNSTAIV